MVKDYDPDCEICKIFSNSNRLKILMALKEKQLTVTEITQKTKLPQPVVSQHLSMMKTRKILETQRKSSFIHYKIKYPEIIDAFEIIEKIREKIQK